MSKGNVFSIIAAALAGAAFATMARVSADAPSAWDNNRVRELVQAVSEQHKALEAISRSSEQQARALQDLVRATERVGEKCHH